MTERIAKFIAHAGICSRRKAEDLVTGGRIKINDIVVTNCATKVTKDDIVKLDDQQLNPKESTRLWLYHKPKGLITSHHDPEGRQTVFDNLPKHLPRLISVGRLDYNTEGLLLLTNDGELSRYLELPATSLIRKYRVRVFGDINLKELATLKQGISIDGINYKPIEIEIEQQGNNSWLNVAITEGKNREIRKIFSHFNLQVNRLIRVAYGPFQLGKLKQGEVIEIAPKTIEQLGNRK